MGHFLDPIQSGLTAGAPAISGVGWILLGLILLTATIILNAVTDASDTPRMTGNFLSLLGGALVGALLFPDLAPPLDGSANLTFALFSGMTAAALVNMAVLKPL